MQAQGAHDPIDQPEREALKVIAASQWAGVTAADIGNATCRAGMAR